MKRRILPILLAAAFMAVGVSPAFADAGDPGTTFPEQPSDHGQCTVLTTNPGTGAGGAAGEVVSPTAGAIVSGLLTDACFGG